jgi:hypothetical protein
LTIQNSPIAFSPWKPQRSIGGGTRADDFLRSPAPASLPAAGLSSVGASNFKKFLEFNLIKVFFILFYANFILFL